MKFYRFVKYHSLQEESLSGTITTGLKIEQYTYMSRRNLFFLSFLQEIIVIPFRIPFICTNLKLDGEKFIDS